EKPLSTVAPIKLIEGLPDHFLVMNGDLLTDLDFADLYTYHLQQKSLLTVSTYHRKTKVDFGVIDVDNETKTATAFREKPEYDFNVSMGVYVMDKKILEMVPLNEPFGFDNLMYAMLDAKKPVSIYNYEGYWLDIGRPDDYEKACIDIETLQAKL
ncbi:MAG: sugar phosphate nucleotidyltransferase, partial [Bacteroidota bacterium]